MKEVKAVIVPTKLESVHRALRAVPGFPGMSVAKVEGYTGATGNAVPTSIREQLTDHRHQLLLMMVLPDELAIPVHDVLVQACRSGGPGQSMVWVTDAERVSFVRNPG